MFKPVRISLRTARIRTGGSIKLKRDLLGHEGDQYSGNGRKPVLAAEYGTIRPSGIDIASIINDDEGD